MLYVFVYSLYFITETFFFKGIDSKTLRYDETISSEKLLGKIKELNEDPSVDGILVQLPLPSHINESEACQSITPNKDVDGFHKENMGKLAIGVKGLVPATPAGVRELLVRSKIDCFGKNAVVIGRSKNVGLPIALLLHADGRSTNLFFFIILHSKIIIKNGFLNICLFFGFRRDRSFGHDNNNLS